VTVIGNQKGFTDVTKQIGIDFIGHRNPIWDTPEWKPKTFEIVKYASAGVTAADYNNDGWYDIFFADGAHPRLYHNNGDGTFNDTTVVAGLPTDLIGTNVAVFADFDNDGDKDLFLGGINDKNRLFHNNGDGTFTDVSENAGLGGYFVTVAAVADYDNDGDLDVYMGRYLDPRTKLPTTLFFTRNSEGNSLLRNDSTFTDASQETGTLDFGFGMSATFGDTDNDGDLDIVINNDPGDILENMEHARATFLRNDLGNHRNWLAVELQGTQSNRDGVGAEVRIEAGGVKQMRHSTIGSGYASQHTLRLYLHRYGA